MAGADGVGEQERAVEQLAARPFADTARLTELSHPHVATVFEIGDRDGGPVVVKEVVRGRPLDRLIKAGRIDLPVLLDLALPIVDGVAAAHELGVPHRDLRPANLVVDARGRPRLVGFRICPTAEDLARTPHYRSPEQLKGEPGGLTSDVFSLGVILYELAVGVRPFDGHSIEHVARSVRERRPLTPIKADPQLSPELSRIIMRALEKNPKKRYPSAVELRSDLVLLKERDGDEPEPNLSPGLQVMREGQRLVALGVGALLVVVVLWALFAGD